MEDANQRSVNVYNFLGIFDSIFRVLQVKPFCVQVIMGKNYNWEILNIILYVTQKEFRSYDPTLQYYLSPQGCVSFAFMPIWTF